MNKLFITALALVAGSLYATADSLVGSSATDGGTYSLYNVGKKQFLGLENGQLVLGGTKVKVRLEAVESPNTPGFFRLVTDGNVLGADLFGYPSAEGGKYTEWRIEYADPSDWSYGYVISSRNREASASMYLYENSIYNRLAGTPTKPATEFEAARWLLVSDEEPETKFYTYSEDDTEYIQHDDAYATIQLARNFELGKWNAFCSPFNIGNAQLKAQFGDDVRLAEFKGFDGGEAQFASTDEIKAGVPYIVCPTAQPQNNAYEFIGNMSFAPSAESVDWGGVSFTGTLAVTALPQHAFVFDANNAIVAAESGATVKGLSGYFATDASHDITSWSLDGVTNIGAVNAESTKATDIYNVGGQKVGKGSASDLQQRGIYIVKGKKLSKK